MDAGTEMGARMAKKIHPALVLAAMDMVELPRLLLFGNCLGGTRYVESVPRRASAVSQAVCRIHSARRFGDFTATAGLEKLVGFLAPVPVFGGYVVEN